jgi:hypothetical protein
MTISVASVNAPAILDFIAGRQVCGSAMVDDLKVEGLLPEDADLGTLHFIGYASGFGMAREGYWYSEKNSPEIAEAFDAHQFPFFADQWFRNRPLPV